MQAKRIDALEKEINELRDKSGGTGAWIPGDLQKLADQVQEIDKKRQADKELILKEIEKTRQSRRFRRRGTRPPPRRQRLPLRAAGPGGPENGYDYKI